MHKFHKLLILLFPYSKNILKGSYDIIQRHTIKHMLTFDSKEISFSLITCLSILHCKKNASLRYLILSVQILSHPWKAVLTETFIQIDIMIPQKDFKDL